MSFKKALLRAAWKEAVGPMREGARRPPQPGRVADHNGEKDEEAHDGMSVHVGISILLLLTRDLCLVHMAPGMEIPSHRFTWAMQA